MKRYIPEMINDFESFLDDREKAYAISFPAEFRERAEKIRSMYFAELVTELSVISDTVELWDKAHDYVWSAIGK